MNNLVDTTSKSIITEPFISTLLTVLSVKKVINEKWYVTLTDQSR